MEMVDTKHNNTYIANILETYNLVKLQKSVLPWIPGHFDIKGNENDELEKFL